MRRALTETRISGANIATTTEFLHDILDHPRFVAADHDTALIGAITEPARIGS